MIAVLMMTFTSCEGSNDCEIISELEYEDTSTNVTSTSRKNTIIREVGGTKNDIVEWVPFYAIEGLRPIFRIPSVTITNNGTTLVACENREIFSDKGKIDILVARKSLGGNEWEIRSVIPYDSLSYGRSMNPIFVIDRMGTFGNRGRIFLFVSHNTNDEKFGVEATTDEKDIVFKYSDDDGRSWSPEYSLKNKWNTAYYTASTPSCANGIQMDDGTLIIPTMFVKDAKWRSGIMYRKPGRDWSFSSPTPNDGDNECTVYVDNQGKLVLDCRTTDYCRRIYIYDMNNDSFELLDYQPKVMVNLKGEIHKCQINDSSLYLLTFVDATKKRNRENVTLYSSLDGLNWGKVYRLQDGEVQGAYSNPVSYNGQTAVCYETGDDIRIQEISHLNYSIYITAVNAGIFSRE